MLLDKKLSLDEIQQRHTSHSHEISVKYVSKDLPACYAKNKAEPNFDIIETSSRKADVNRDVQIMISVS